MSNRPILHVCYLSSFYQVLCHPGDPKQVEPACLCFLVQDVNSYMLISITVSCAELVKILFTVNTRVLVNRLLDYKEEVNKLP